VAVGMFALPQYVREAVGAFNEQGSRRWADPTWRGDRLVKFGHVRAIACQTAKPPSQRSRSVV
jgi:hypothetical protein